MSWDTERDDIITRMGGAEADIKVLREAMHNQDRELRQCITGAVGTVRQELVEEKRNLGNAINTVRDEMSITQREIERNSVRLGFVIAIGSFISAGVLALFIGLLPYMMESPEQDRPRVSMPFDQRMQMIIDVIAHMDTANQDLWTASGLPRADVIERELSSRLGYPVKVTEIERSRAAVIAGVVGK